MEKTNKLKAAAAKAGKKVLERRIAKTLKNKDYGVVDCSLYSKKWDLEIAELNARAEERKELLIIGE